jgi:Glyoxalase/Bleomycin resistance protein/Dioxygenase superfamily
MFMVMRFVLTGAMLGIIFALSAPTFASPDPLISVTKTDPEAASPLRQGTITTGNFSQSKAFFADALGMQASDPAVLPIGEARRLGLRIQTKSIIFTRAGIDEAVRVRSILVPAQWPALRPTHSALVSGGLALGMPVVNQARREALVTVAGFDSAAGVTRMSLPREDGSSYEVEEIHYRGPDGVLVLGIDRGALTPVGPIDAKSGIGGPAYASLVVENLPATEAFLKTVLRYEKRRDAIFVSAGPRGGLGLDSGQRFAFQQWFAPGTRTGYLVIIKLLDRAGTSSQAGGSTKRGLMMWSFDAANISAVAERAKRVGARIISQPTKTAPSLIVAMPDGFLVEFTKRGAQG